MKSKILKNFSFILTAICILLQMNFAYAEVIRLEPTEKNQLKLEHNNTVQNKNLVIQALKT